jgi:pimeloyl-ACP methyl ester carboxylesterase
MKIKRGMLKVAFSIVLFLTIITSCKKDNQNSENNYNYFVSKKLVQTYKKDNITSLLDLASIALPEVSAIKPFVATDINVFKVVYKTTVDGNEINASGLICVPVTAGNYPVISFQNGTNTINAEAPSLSPASFNYQLVEIIASLGYAVVIADYPGFGESSQIPHPYLIRKPTVQSLVDLLYTAKETGSTEFQGITFKNEYYLLGYSQGGWATLSLHKALEINYKSDFNLKGSACGAGPYDISLLMNGIVTRQTYPMPSYLAYIVNAYIAYNQFSNTAADIFNEPYASSLGNLFKGTLTLAQINSQLTTSMPGLLTPGFVSGFASDSKYSTVRAAIADNSVEAWHTAIPLLLTHGANDTQVDPLSTENMYNSMILAGTSTDIMKKEIVPGVDHSDGAIPCMVKGILFLNTLKNSNN